MRLLLALLASAGSAMLASRLTRPGADAPGTVGEVDLARYAGTWFEMARIPTIFQDGPKMRAEDVTATYRLRPDGRVDVVNRCRNALAGYAERSVHGVARSASPGHDRLRVTFCWPIRGDYWVIGLDPDYRWAVVGTPWRDDLWILSRSRHIAVADMTAALSIAQREGFDIARLRRTPQSGGDPRA